MFTKLILPMFSIAGCIVCLAGCDTKTADIEVKGSEVVLSRPPDAAATGTVRLLREMKNKLDAVHIGEHGFWRIGKGSDEYLTYYVERDAAQNEIESLYIVDSKGRTLFHDSATSFGPIQQSYLLRQSYPQLIMPEVNEGGSGRFFRALDYRESRVSALTDDADTLHSGTATIVPQYQDNAYFSKPYQILLGETLASESAPAILLRYKDGKFQPIGRLSQTEAAADAEIHLER